MPWCSSGASAFSSSNPAAISSAAGGPAGGPADGLLADGVLAAGAPPGGIPSGNPPSGTLAGGPPPGGMLAAGAPPGGMPSGNALAGGVRSGAIAGPPGRGDGVQQPAGMPEDGAVLIRQAAQHSQRLSCVNRVDHETLRSQRRVRRAFAGCRRHAVTQSARVDELNVAGHDGQRAGLLLNGFPPGSLSVRGAVPGRAVLRCLPRSRTLPDGRTPGGSLARQPTAASGWLCSLSLRDALARQSRAV